MFVGSHEIGAADIPQLTSLVQRYWEFERIEGFDAARTAALLARLCAQPALGSAWVAESGGELVGYLVAVSVLSLEHQGLMAEIDELYGKLLANGGKEQACGWVQDRFGPIWQVNYKRLPEMIAGGDSAAYALAFGAMMTMKKIDVKKLEDAYAGK